MPKEAKGLDAHKWKRSKADKEGWFKLEDPKSKMFLSSNSTDSDPFVKGTFDKSLLKSKCSNFR